MINTILESHREELNSINVFPIADKDTGNNLCKTLDNDCFKIDRWSKDTVDKLANDVLNTARGSSGNILALFILGLSKNYSDNLTDMCMRASEFAWNTMYHPVEGTMLTALKDVPKSYDSTDDFIYKYIQNTLCNLMRGPDKLPILKKHRTIDSGTLGLLYVLCGIYMELTGLDITPDIRVVPVDSNIDCDDPRYCVEVLLYCDTCDSLYCLDGDELIIAYNKGRAKVHIHTNDYELVLKACNDCGKVIDYRVDDMKSGVVCTNLV